MPLSKGYKNIPLRPIIVDIVEKKWKKDYKKNPNKINPTLSGYINELLIEIMEKQEFLEKFAPNLSVVGYLENRITLQDLSIKNKDKVKYIDLIVENNMLRCMEDDVDDCIHCFFAWASPEIAKLNLKKPVFKDKSSSSS